MHKNTVDAFHLLCAAETGDVCWRKTCNGSAGALPDDGVLPYVVSPDRGGNVVWDDGTDHRRAS